MGNTDIQHDRDEESRINNEQMTTISFEILTTNFKTLNNSPVLPQLQQYYPDFESIYLYKRDGIVPDNHSKNIYVVDAYNYEIILGTPLHISQTRSASKMHIEKRRSCNGGSSCCTTSLASSHSSGVP